MAETALAPIEQQVNGVPQDIMHMVFPETTQAPIATPATQEPVIPPATEPAATVVPPTAEENFVDANEYLNQQLGYKSWEEAKAELEQLRQLKANPPKSEYEWKSEDAKRIASWVNEGKEDELADYYSTKKMLKGLDTMNDEQKLKLYIKMQNPLYDPELVDARFQRDYGFDEASFKDDDGNITDQMAFRLAKIDALQKRQNDISKAGDFFNQYKSKIEFPAINQAQTTIDKEYEEYKASTAKSSEAYEKVVVPTINALTEADVAFKFTMNDPNNQMNFDVSVIPEKTDLDAAKANGLDFYGFLNSFYDDKGNFNGKEFEQMILLKNNWGKYASTIARQAVNAERARVIAKETPSSTARDNSIIEEGPKTETEKNLAMAWSV